MSLIHGSDPALLLTGCRRSNESQGRYQVQLRNEQTKSESSQDREDLSIQHIVDGITGTLENGYRAWGFPGPQLVDSCYTD